MLVANSLLISRFTLVLVLLVLASSILACVEVSNSDGIGHLPEHAVEPTSWLAVSNAMEIMTSSLEEGVEVTPSGFGLLPEEGYHYIFVGVSVRCREGSGRSFCTIDSGDFTLFGDDAIVYDEREEITSVPEHLGTIVPEDIGDVMLFDYGRTEIPSGRTRDAVLIFTTRQSDSNYVLSYRNSYYWQVPAPEELTEELEADTGTEP